MRQILKSSMGIAIFALFFAFQNCSHEYPAEQSNSSQSAPEKILGIYDNSTVTQVDFQQTPGDTFLGARIPQVRVSLDWTNQRLSANVTDEFAGQNQSCSVSIPVQSDDFRTLTQALLKADLANVQPPNPPIGVAGAPTFSLAVSLSDSSEHTYQFQSNASLQGLLIIDNNSGLLSFLEALGNRITCDISTQ